MVPPYMFPDECVGVASSLSSLFLYVLVLHYTLPLGEWVRLTSQTGCPLYMAAPHLTCTCLGVWAWPARRNVFSVYVCFSLHAFSGVGVPGSRTPLIFVTWLFSLLHYVCWVGGRGCLASTTSFR